MIKEEDQSWGSFILEVVILVGVVLFIRFYIFQFFRVSGPSMCPTLNVIDDECRYQKGEFIFVNEFLYNFMRDPQKGEVVVFRPPEKKHYVKRVIGTPGDTVELKHGKVYLTNDEVSDFEIPEPYLSPKNQGRTKVYKRSHFTVPEDHYLLFGDNRAESLDARHCYSSSGCDGKHTPFIHKRHIKGKANFVIWPVTKMRWIETMNFFEHNKTEESSSEEE